MALVRKIDRVKNQAPRVHGTVACEVDGTAYLQLNTFGSATRSSRGAISQSMQFDKATLVTLKSLIDDALKAGNEK